VLHTINPRLFPEQIEYIANHAEDTFVFFDLSFTGLLEAMAPRLQSVKAFVALTDAEHMPQAGFDRLLCYETLLSAADEAYDWPLLDENTASSLCYTSGTTGNPKGVLYSHRSIVLHAFCACARDGLSLSSQDSVMLVVPLFHVNAWGIPYAAAMCGAKLVLPGQALDGRSLFELMAAERCNFSLGVPTVWLGFFKYIDDNPGLPLGDIKLERVVVGGSAAPRAVIEKFHALFGAFTIHAWGMSETSPLATIGNLLPKHRDLPTDEIVDVQVKQGRAIYGVELKIVDAEGRKLAQDGAEAGDLLVRGPWVTAGYFKGEGGVVLDADGWFATGDVAKIDADGYVRITDRSKDVIKSGGEWISSIDLENAALGCPGVQEAAVIGVRHEKWQERPLLIVVPKAGATPTGAEILGFLADKIPKWWMPDDVVFVDALPHTATGKIQKLKLRQQFADHVLPGAAAPLAAIAS
jgi:acyl-CoA synthetase (AMP-forming)/AMP-acid ligase II